MIKKYSLVKILQEEKICYVTEIVDGLLRLSNHGALVPQDEKIVEVKLPGDLPSEELVEVERQLKILAGVYSAEHRRRKYDIEKRKTKSKWWGDKI